MPATRTACLSLPLLFVFLQMNHSSYSQVSLDSPKKWAEELSKKNDKQNKQYARLDSLMQFADSAYALYYSGTYASMLDSATIFNFINDLAEKGRSKGDYFQVRFNCLKTTGIYLTNRHNLAPFKEEVKQLLGNAMDIAYKTEDEDLIAFASSTYAHLIYQFGELGLAVMYSMNGIDLSEKLSAPVRPSDYQFLAEMLYKVKEYNDCIKYGKKAVTAWKNSPNEYKQFTVSCINTVALGFHRQNIYDSALTYYQQAFQLAEQIKDTVWTGIVSGNIAQIYFAQQRYDTAYTLLINDYRKSKARGFYDNAANSLQWAARVNLAKDNKATSLAQVREAFQLLKLWPDPGYLRNTYYTSTQIFRNMGAYDSAFYYNNLYSTINDSLEKVVATSSLVISKARLNDELSRYNIQNLNKERRSQLLLRNIIIVGIILLSLFMLLIVNRKRLKTKMKMEKAEQEKLLIEQEVVSARAQLEMFTTNILEKTNLIEKLELKAKDKQASSEQQTIISELSRQTILTEDDWQKFKSLFEKIYPGFFINLKNKFHDITLAEQRMASLIRLHLTTKQMASMLGISVDSVHKTRQRLRQRLQLSNDGGLEETIAAI